MHFKNKEHITCMYVHAGKKGMPLISIMEGMGKKVLKEDLYETKNIASDVCIHCICLNLLQK